MTDTVVALSVGASISESTWLHAYRSLQVPGACPSSAGRTFAFALLPGYCAANFIFNTLGLFLTVTQSDCLDRVLMFDQNAL